MKNQNPRPVTNAASAVSPTADTNPTQRVAPAATSPRTKRRYKEVWLVEEHTHRKAWWTRVGVAFENKDGSWNLHLSAVPVAGNVLQVRDPRPNEGAQDDGQTQVAA